MTIPRMQRVIQLANTGGPEVLELTEQSVPVPETGEVLVKVAAIGVNFIETYQRSGVYPMPLPFIPGGEFSGTVVAIGPDVDSINIGDTVMTNGGREGYAEYAIIPEKAVIPVPSSLDLPSAAAIPLQGMTAHYLARSSYEIQDGDTVLIHAGAGGVGLILTQIAKILGATVITTASTEKKRELSRANGADFSLPYENFSEHIREITEGEGVHAAYDGVGKDTYLGSIQSLRRRGHAVIFGGASGQVPPLDIQILNRAGSVFLSRPTLIDFTVTRDEIMWRAEELFTWIAAGELHFATGGTYSLSDAAIAHADLEGRRTTAKILLKP